MSLQFCILWSDWQEHFGVRILVVFVGPDRSKLECRSLEAHIPDRSTNVDHQSDNKQNLFKNDVRREVDFPLWWSASEKFLFDFFRENGFL